MRGRSRSSCSERTHWTTSRSAGAAARARGGPANCAGPYTRVSGAECAGSAAGTWIMYSLRASPIRGQFRGLRGQFRGLRGQLRGLHWQLGGQQPVRGHCRGLRGQMRGRHSVSRACSRAGDLGCVLSVKSLSRSRAVTRALAWASRSVPWASRAIPKRLPGVST